MGSQVTKYLAGMATRMAGDGGSQSAVQILQEYGDKIAKGLILPGRVLTSASEAGGSFSYSFPQGTTPDQALAQIQDAIDYLNGDDYGGVKFCVRSSST